MSVIDTPQIVKIEPKITATLHIVVPRSEIQSVMGAGIQEVLAAIAEQGLQPTGPLFTHHSRIDSTLFDFEIVVPISESIKPVGRVKPGEFRARTAARAIYRGPYEGLAKAWEEFKTWIADHEHFPASDIWETYLTGPHSSPDPKEWITELYQPLA